MKLKECMTYIISQIGIENLSPVMREDLDSADTREWGTPAIEFRQDWDMYTVHIPALCGTVELIYYAEKKQE